MSEDSPPTNVVPFTTNWQPDIEKEPPVTNGKHPKETIPDGAKAVRKLRLTCAADITIQPVYWLWKHRVPLGMFSLLAGREGIGKSMLAYQLAADITRGTLPGAHMGTPKAVIIAATEDSWAHTIVPRLMAAGADLTLIFQIDVTINDEPYGSLTLPADNDELGELVAETGAALVLLDPLMSRISGKLDTHKDADVRQSLEPLGKLAEKYETTVLGLIHVNKSGHGDALQRIMASKAFAAVARSVIYVVKDPEDSAKRLANTEKNNLGRTDHPTLVFSIENHFVGDTPRGAVFAGRLRWMEDTDRTIEDALAFEGLDSEVRTLTDEAAVWLREYLEINGACRSKDVKADAKKDDIADHNLKRALKRVGIIVESTNTLPRTTTWSLPKAGTHVSRRPEPIPCPRCAGPDQDTCGCSDRARYVKE